MPPFFSNGRTRPKKKTIPWSLDASSSKGLEHKKGHRPQMPRSLPTPEPPPSSTAAAPSSLSFVKLQAVNGSHHNLISCSQIANISFQQPNINPHDSKPHYQCSINFEAHDARQCLAWFRRGIKEAMNLGTTERSQLQLGDIQEIGSSLMHHFVILKMDVSPIWPCKPLKFHQTTMSSAEKKLLIAPTWSKGSLVNGQWWPPRMWFPKYQILHLPLLLCSSTKGPSDQYVHG